MADANDDAPGGAAAIGGDDALVGLDRIYRDQAPRLRRRLRADGRSHEDANDIVHDAFARLLGACSRQVLRTPEAFLNRIVGNLLIDRARRRAVRGFHMSIDDGPEIAARPDQADGIELAQLREQYRKCVEALPKRTREVFLLHRVDGLTYKTIAARLDISPHTVEWHIAEAIFRISKGLDRS